MKLLSFAGTGDLRETVYAFHDDQWKTAVVQEALSHFFPVSEIVIFTTERSKSKNGNQITGCLQGVPLKLIDIPDGKDEDELWKIFSTLVDEVQPGDEILFDITHGFRSLPFIAFLTVAYLKDVKGAKIKGIMYGAFDARDHDVSPIFDLSPFASLLDWMAAVRSFLVHSDASGINDLICNINTSFHLPGSTGDTPDPVFTRFSKKLDMFSLAVRLSRPIEGISVAQEITNLMPGVTHEIRKYSPALVPVLGKIGEIERFSPEVSNKVQPLDSDFILKQRELILYQIEHGLYIQAVTMTREWIVSVLIYASGNGEKWLDKDIRYEAERTLSGAERHYRGEEFEKTDFLDRFTSTGYSKDISEIWAMVSQIRNDLAHCGMNNDKQKAKSLRDRVCKIKPSTLDTVIRLMDEGF